MTQALAHPARSAVAEIPVTTIAGATLDKAQRDGMFWRLRPGRVVAPTAAGVPRVLYDGDTVPVPVVSMIGPLPEGARVQVVLSPPSGNHVVGYQGTPANGAGLIAYYPRRTNKAGITAEVGLLRVDGVGLVNGHLYRVKVSGVTFNNVSTRLFMRLRIRTDGLAAGLASPILSTYVWTLGAAGTLGGTRFVEGYLVPTADITLSTLATLQADSSVNTAIANTESPNVFTVEDLGLIGSTVVTAGVDV